jgi:hypothetical protein
VLIGHFSQRPRAIVPNSNESFSKDRPLLIGKNLFCELYAIVLLSCTSLFQPSRCSLVDDQVFVAKLLGRLP